MTKDDFLDAVEKASEKFEVMGVRVHKDRNYGLDIQTYSLWLVGEHSLATNLVMSVDTYPLLVKFRSMEKATKEMIKLGKWLDKIQK
ncbi:hypothetical protein [Escherichia phage vB_EcoM-UFV05]|nr:hypothetical protein [Escherichia phage vB_EcoM-UFV09]UYE93210.1 hypothetical protein [Escherichia phage vB_EcoM-UFV05]UYL84103.1 hypothetical protein [Escherichia phage vB_EcoM-UFV06]UYL84389.1 hypothetical protein [Escherichia phage vB_EcoM-UFV10]UYL84675.1 hypothetical protein [Escherichia phage vB_EcoM-UFV11]